MCLGTKAKVQERVNNFLGGLAIRRDEVNGAAGPSCSQEPTDSCEIPSPIPHGPVNAHPTLALV